MNKSRRISIYPTLEQVFEGFDEDQKHLAELNEKFSEMDQRRRDFGANCVCEDNYFRTQSEISLLKRSKKNTDFLVASLNHGKEFDEIENIYRGESQRNLDQEHWLDKGKGRI